MNEERTEESWGHKCEPVLEHRGWIICVIPHNHVLHKKSDANLSEPNYYATLEGALGGLHNKLLTRRALKNAEQGATPERLARSIEETKEEFSALLTPLQPDK